MPCEPLVDDSPDSTGGGAAWAAGLALGHLAISASLTWKLAAICDGGRPSCRCSPTISQLTARPPPPAPAHEYKAASNGTIARIQSLARRIGDRILPPLVYAEAAESGRLCPIPPMRRKSRVTHPISRGPACVSPKTAARTFARWLSSALREDIVGPAQPAATRRKCPEPPVDVTASDQDARAFRPCLCAPTVACGYPAVTIETALMTRRSAASVIAGSSIKFRHHPIPVIRSKGTTLGDSQRS